jgi:hypothetical protein
MVKIEEITVLESYKIRIAFNNRVEGIWDFSGIIGVGVFKSLVDYTEFSKVEIGRRGRTLIWPKEIDICADSLLFEDNIENVTRIT